ncbi:MAG TPA: 4Fe-4S dicluster domain-containing protein [Thermoanaerobaculia bacterium]|nr:4Fe-4S dicluster domain-containing protein [Thermoanaerobaculia bacterium]
MRVPAVIMLAFWALGIALWLKTGVWFFFLNFAYIGTSVGAGMGLYRLLPKRKKHWGRKLAQLLVGIYMLGLLGFLAHENMQIEGFWFYLFGGFFAGSVIHYLVAKIIGPLLFGRAWCSWSCWTAMVLDFLPFTRNDSLRVPRAGLIRYVHFAISFGIVALLFFGFGYRPRRYNAMAFWWLMAGTALYYVTAVVLAFEMRDNRAFCKYVCPIPALQKITSRFSLLKIAGDPAKCTDCGSCSIVCPMDIRIPDYVRSGRRVLATECILCFSCTNACASGALHTSFGFDVDFRGSLLRFR